MPNSEKKPRLPHPTNMGDTAIRGATCGVISLCPCSIACMGKRDCSRNFGFFGTGLSGSDLLEKRLKAILLFLCILGGMPDVTLCFVVCVLG